MLKASKSAKILLFFIISFSVPILSGYLIYCDIALDDPFSTELQYENDDMDDSFLIPKSEHHFSVESNALVVFSLPVIQTVEQESPSWSLPCRKENPPVLRC